VTSEHDPAPDSQLRNEHHGDAWGVIQVGRIVGDVVLHPGRTPLRRRIFLAALFAVLIVGTASVIQHKFPFDFESVVADPATTSSQPKTDSSVMPPPSTTRSEPAPSELKPPPPGPAPVTTTTSPTTHPTQPRADSWPSRSCMADKDSSHAIHGGDWGQICTISPGDFYDYIVACDGEADGQTAYSMYHLVDGFGFSEYRTVADTDGVSNGCVHVDWRGTKYWARAVAICKTPSSCSGWIYTPETPSAGKPTS